MTEAKLHSGMTSTSLPPPNITSPYLTLWELSSYLLLRSDGTRSLLPVCCTITCNSRCMQLFGHGCQNTEVASQMTICIHPGGAHVPYCSQLVIVDMFHAVLLLFPVSQLYTHLTLFVLKLRAVFFDTQKTTSCTQARRSICHVDRLGWMQDSPWCAKGPKA